MTGAEAVASALGPVATDATRRRDTARVLVPVMVEHCVDRLVEVSGVGIDVPDGGGEVACDPLVYSYNRQIQAE